MKKTTTTIIAALAVATAAFADDEQRAEAEASKEEVAMAEWATPAVVNQQKVTKAAAAECVAKYGKDIAKHLPEVKKIAKRVGEDVVDNWKDFGDTDSTEELRDTFYMEVLGELHRQGNLEDKVWDREYEKDVDKWGDE